jgi:hypothetical protein
MKKTKRTGFTWDQEYKSHIPDIEREISGWGERENTITNADLFMLCVAVGFATGTERPVPPRRTDSARLDAVGLESLAMLKVVAMAKSDNTEDLMDEDLLFDRIESYAAGGLMLLADAVAKNKNFKDWLRGKLLDFIRESNSR